MPYSFTMDQQLKPSQNIRQMQRLIMSRQMQQAIHLLQVPVMELAPLVELELEQNPVLENVEDDEEEGLNDKDEDLSRDLERLKEDVTEEILDFDSKENKEVDFDDKDFEILKRLDEDFRDHFNESDSRISKRTTEDNELQSYIESSIQSVPTLFEHLMAQTHEVFQTDVELTLAEAIIGSINDSGFLKSPLEEIALLQNCSVKTLEKILDIIQTFTPIGVGARDLKESLLIQLKAIGKEKTLAYAIIEKSFDDLVHNNIPAIKKDLHCTVEEISEMIDKHICHLDLHPGAQVGRHSSNYMTPDLTMFLNENDELEIRVNDDSMPRLRLNRKYMKMLDDPTSTEEERNFIKQKVLSAKWLLRNLMQRNDTLEKIGNEIAKRQKAYFLSANGKMTPMTMKTVAGELALHESTIARAVSNKYIETPRGLLPLKSFFTGGLESDIGDDVSSNTARDLIKEIIAKENKNKPLSDEELSHLLKDQGIHCARRTIAKYRTALNLGNTRQRKKF